MSTKITGLAALNFLYKVTFVYQAKCFQHLLYQVSPPHTRKLPASSVQGPISWCGISLRPQGLVRLPRAVWGLRQMDILRPANIQANWSFAERIFGPLSFASGNLPSPGTPAQELQRMIFMDQQQHLSDYCVDLVSTTFSTTNPTHLTHPTSPKSPSPLPLQRIPSTLLPHPLPPPQNRLQCPLQSHPIKPHTPILPLPPPTPYTLDTPLR